VKGQVGEYRVCWWRVSPFTGWATMGARFFFSSLHTQRNISMALLRRKTTSASLLCGASGSHAAAGFSRCAVAYLFSRIDNKRIKRAYPHPAKRISNSGGVEPWKKTTKATSNGLVRTGEQRYRQTASARIYRVRLAYSTVVAYGGRMTWR